MEKTTLKPTNLKQINKQINELMSELKEQGISAAAEEPMSKHTSFKAGGKAALLVTVDTEDQLRYVLRRLNEVAVPTYFLGNGSNVLFRDEGYDGVVVKLGDGFAKILVEGEHMIIGAAALLSTAAKEAMKAQLTGMEFAGGIPGSLGGAVFMNAGAYGGEIKDILIDIKAMPRDGGDSRTLTAEELELGYRHSALTHNGYIATEVRIKLSKGRHEEIAATMKELAEKRNSKQPLNYPSAGSTFKRPEGYFAGKLIEDADLKGVTIGGAQVSTLHSGFVINRGGATATDILDLMALIQNMVYDKFGVILEPEVRIVG